MTNDPHCPRCRSANVVFSKKRQLNFCEDCELEFVVKHSIVPLRIFLSYGHDGNEELVRRIKSDLELRGHDVWFDKSEIKFGDDWRRSITEGITGSHKFVSFLSKHSTRDPGVCLDEIGIAIGVKEGNIQTILVESELEVQPPPGVGHTQWLDMHDWKDRRDANESAWENWYQEKFVEIVRVVESDESRRFAGEIETLKNHLKPIKSDSRIYELLKKGFTGRQWLFEAVEKWRTSDRASRVFWLMGAPGVGKSAVAAQLAIHGREVIAVEFCNWQQPGHKNPEQIVRTLAFQIATRLPDYRKFLLDLPEIKGDKLDGKNGAELFDCLLANPLHHAIDGSRERYLIVIDALDEAADSGSSGAGHNPLVQMLAAKASLLPDWIGLVVTSRPESNVIAPLQALNPFPFESSSEKNLADIRDYLRHDLASQIQGRADTDQLVEQILEKSEGVFLYVERFCDDIRRGHLSLDRPEQFPQGLGGIFFQYFQRQFPDLESYERTIEPALGAILASREPLPVEILQELFDWRETELKKWLRRFGSLFPVTSEAGHEVIKPHHKSLADWLTDEKKAGEYFVSAGEGNKLLAETCWQEYRRGPLNMSRYAIAHLAKHLILTKQWNTVEYARSFNELPSETSESCGQEAIFRLARDKAFLSAQLRCFPDEPQLVLSTIQEAILTACRNDEPNRMAEFCLTHAGQSFETMRESPLEVLRAGSFRRASRIADYFPDEHRTCWLLLLADELYEEGRHDTAKQILDELLRSGSAKPSSDIVELIFPIASIDSAAFNLLQKALLDESGREALCRRLVRAQLNGRAIEIARQIERTESKGKLLGNIAAAQMRAGEHFLAKATLQEAFREAENVFNHDKKMEVQRFIRTAQSEREEHAKVTQTPNERRVARTTLSNATQNAFLEHVTKIRAGVLNEIRDHRARRVINAATGEGRAIYQKDELSCVTTQVTSTPSESVHQCTSTVEHLSELRALAARLTTEAELCRGNAWFQIIGPAERLKDVAVSLANAGDANAARQTLIVARETALAVDMDAPQEQLLVSIAEMQASIGDYVAADETCRLMSWQKSRDEALGNIAASQARSGEFNFALKTAQRIQLVHMRLASLCRIAVAYADRGRGEEAVDLIGQVPPNQSQHYLAVAKALARGGDKPNFKQLLLPCSYHIWVTYQICELLAQLYPDQAASVADALIQKGVDGDTINR